MLTKVRFFKRLFTDLPRQVRLAYCLFYDARIPVVNKAIFAGGMGLILTPFIDVPEFIPVVGELDVLALTLVALKLFIATAPPEVIADHEQLILERRSRFDEDVLKGEGLVIRIWERFFPESGEDLSGTPEPARNTEVMA